MQCYEKTQIIEEIYKQIAAEQGATPEEVEREILEAIRFAWRRGNISPLTKAAQRKVAYAGEMPTGEELIAHVVERIEKMK